MLFVKFPLLCEIMAELMGPMVFGRELLDDTDSRVAYFSSTFLLKVKRCIFLLHQEMKCINIVAILLI